MKKSLRMLMSMLLPAACTMSLNAATVTSWVKVDATELVTGDVVVIVDQTSSTAMSNDKGTQNPPVATSVTLNTTKSAITSEVAANLQWEVTVNEPEEDGDPTTYQFGVTVDDETSYLYCTNSNNGVRMGAGDNNQFTWVADESNANSTEYFLVNTGNSRYVGVYYSNSAPQDWRCYTSINANIKNTVTAFYKKVITEVSGAVDPNVTFAEDNLTIEVGETVTNDIDYPDGLTITFSSSDDEIATVDPETGEVEGISAGEVTITASWDELSGQYNSGSIEYTLTVNAASNKPTYIKANGITALTENDVFIIVGTKSDGHSYAMSNDNGTSAPSAVEVTISGNKIATDATNILWNITVNTDGDATTYTFNPEGSSNTLYCLNTNNGLKVGTETTNKFNIKDDYIYSVDQSRYVGVYLAQDWRSYGSINNNIKDQTFAFYVLSDNRQDAGLTYETALVEVEEGADPFTNELTNPNSLEVTYSSSNDAVASVDPTTGLVTVEGTGNATITATFEGNDTYRSGSASYTVNVTAAPYTSIAQLQEAATSTSTPIRVTFTNVQVTALSGTSNAYICDEEGNGALIYTSGHGLTAGQIINGTLSCNLVLYKGQTEITGFSSTGLTITDGDLDPTPMTINEITAANQSRYVRLTKVMYVSNGNKLVDDDGYEIAFYDTFKTNATLEDGKYYDIDGIVILFNTTLEFAPLTAESISAHVEAPTVEFEGDVVVVQLGDYVANSISLDPADLVINYYAEEDVMILFDEENPGYFWANAVGVTTIYATWDEQEIDGITYSAGEASYTVIVEDQEPELSELAIDEDNAYTADLDYYNFVYLTRTFKADQINTLVVPFDIPENEAKNAFGENIVIYELAGLKTSKNGAASLSFENVTSQGIRAGVPCLIKNVIPNDDNVYTFEDCDISGEAPEVSFVSDEDPALAFIGTYEPTEIEADESNYVISNSKLFVVNIPVEMKGTRAYIYAPGANGAKMIGMEFSDGTTGIMDVATGTIMTGKVYDMSGREVKTPTRGMYIVNGKKVLY